MKADKITFGTNLRVGDSQQAKLAHQSKNFLDGLILAGAHLEKNGIDDDFVLKLSPKNFKSTGNSIADAFEYNNPKKMNQISFTWLSPGYGGGIKEKTISLKKLNSQTPNQIKDYILATVARFQTKKLSTKSQSAEKRSNKEIIKTADDLARLSLQDMRLAAQKRKTEKGTIEGVDNAIAITKMYFKQAGVKFPKPSSRKEPTQKQLKAHYLVDKYGIDDFGCV
jgi:hypothetical protein